MSVAPDLTLENDQEIAKKILDHLGLKPENLPPTMIDDRQNFLKDPVERLMTHWNEDSLWTLKTARFLKDFVRYKAKPHMQTSNKSFLRTAELFRQMGIKNYYFLLQLNNPMLENVNPWDENLTDEIKAMVLQECRENIWYTIREVIKIDGRRFRANRAVISFIWSCLNHLQTLILMPRQSGKLARHGTQVLMATGQHWKPIEEIQLGDRVLAWDGTPSSVTGVYPQGTQDIYRVHFVDGRTADVGHEHLWTVWDAGKGRRGKWRTLDTGSVMERMLELKNSNAKNHLSIPLVEADRTTPHIDFKIDPYIIGVLIGDGCLSQGSVGYCKPDIELAKRVTARLPAGYILSPHADGKTFGIVRGPDFNPFRHVNLQDELTRLELLYSKFDTKRIPKEYKHGSHAQRLMLLRGLMDTDGTAEKGGNTYYSTSNKELAKDVQRLAWSLGNICSIADRKEPKYTYKGETFTSKHAYRVNIRSRNATDLFLDPKRKGRVEDCKRGEKFNSKLAIYGIEKLPEQYEATCIEIDHPDNLYVMDDHIVTHNTVGMQVMAFIMQYLVGRGFRSGLITLAASNRMQFVNAIKKIRSGLPEYLVNMTYKDNDAGNILSYQAYGEDQKNTFEVRVPSGGEDGAENVSRGSTFEVLLIDEPAWMKYIENILNGAGPSTLTAQKNAREKGIPYFTAKATTPNSILKDEGRYMYNEMMESTEWREAFFDSYSESHLLERCIKASPKLTTAPQICMQFNHLQLGFGKDWVKETMDKLRLSWSKAKIDLLMMWTEEGKNKLFDDKTRERLSDCKAEPIWNEEIGDTGLFVDWFFTQSSLKEMYEDPTEYFLIGVDTSDAMNKDACTVVIRRMKDGGIIGIGRYPIAYLDDITVVIRAVMLRIENSLLIIERNRAMQIIEQLLLSLPALGIDPFKRIFNRIYQDPVKYKNEWKQIQETGLQFRTKDFYLRFKPLFGFYTDAESRKQMYDYVHEAVRTTGASIRYSMLIDELIGLETDTSDRIDHGRKSHDDLVIAWLLSYWFIKRGYNKALYGIPQGYTMTEVTTLVENPDAVHYSKDQMELLIRVKERIEQLGKELENTDSELIAKRIEMEITKLTDFVPKDMRKTITIDDVIANANAERKKRSNRNRFNNNSGNPFLMGRRAG